MTEEQLLEELIRHHLAIAAAYQKRLATIKGKMPAR